MYIDFIWSFKCNAQLVIKVVKVRVIYESTDDRTSN